MKTSVFGFILGIFMILGKFRMPLSSIIGGTVGGIVGGFVFKKIWKNEITSEATVKRINKIFGIVLVIGCSFLLYIFVLVYQARDTLPI